MNLRFNGTVLCFYLANYLHTKMDFDVHMQLLGKDSGVWGRCFIFRSVLFIFRWGGGGNECSLHHIRLRCSWARHRTPNCSPGSKLLQVCVHGVCVHCCVCALWMGKCRARILSMGYHAFFVCKYVTPKCLKCTKNAQYNCKNGILYARQTQCV